MLDTDRSYRKREVAIDIVSNDYAKFGDLLAESKAITGGKEDE